MFLSFNKNNCKINFFAFDKICKLIFLIKNNQKTRFLAVGGYNTLFFYLAGLVFFNIFTASFFKIILFHIFGSVHSYLTHKFLSFKQKKYCNKEVIRAIIVYGSMYIFSGFFMMFLINLGFSQIVAFHLNLFLNIIIFYILHSKFTFKNQSF